jgi:hypothetical protein
VPSDVLTVTTGGRTFAGNPPALTLYERNGAIWEIALFLIGLVLMAGLADLLFRAGRRITGPGLSAMVAGGLLVLYSLFGLIYGLLGIGNPFPGFWGRRLASRWLLRVEPRLPVVELGLLLGPAARPPAAEGLDVSAHAPT